VKARPGAGYSGTPLPKKLGMKPGMIVALLGAPSSFGSILGSLPEGVTLRRGMKGTADLVIWFVRSGKELTGGIRQVAAFAGTANVWIAWRKKAAVGKDDPGSADAPDEQGVRTAGLATDLVDFKVCAIDAEWSGLLFARRRN
jgi:hypothetical protein